MTRLLSLTLYQRNRNLWMVPSTIIIHNWACPKYNGKSENPGFRSLKYELRSLVSCCHCGSILVSYTKGGRFEPFYCNEFFPLNSGKHLGKTQMSFIKFLISRMSFTIVVWNFYIIFFAFIKMSFIKSIEILFKLTLLSHSESNSEYICIIIVIFISVLTQ